MGKKYNYVSFEIPDEGEKPISYLGPSGIGSEFEKYDNPKVIKTTYGNGDESIQIINGKTVEVFATFPLDLEQH